MLEAPVATVQMALAGGAFQTGFALYLGCSEFVIGMIAAIPSFAGLLQLLASGIAGRFGARKRLVPWLALISRLLWVPMFLIPFVLPHPLWVEAFLILTGIASVAGNISAPLWTAWISDLVPEDNRGRYFGQRNMYGGIVSLIVPVVGGWFLDTETKSHALSQPVTFALIFGFASLFALGSFGLGMSSPDVPSQEAQATVIEPGTKRGLGQALTDLQNLYAAPFADQNFRRFMIFATGFGVAQNIAGQFFTVYQLKILHLDYTALQLLGGVATLASLAAMPLWGYLADKYGNKPILTLCCIMVLAPPFLWLLAVPDGISGLWAISADGGFRLSYTKLDITVLNLIAGMGWAGVGLTQFNLMIGIAPSAQRTVYISAIAAVGGIAGGIAPLVGGWILVLLAHVHFPAHGYVRNNFGVLFILSGLLRAAFIFTLQPVQEVGSSSARYVLKQLRATKPIGSFTGLQKLSRAENPEARRHAAEDLARLKTPVAVEELVKALDDVALPVREQAAVALGEIGDARAVTSLVQKLTDPAAGIAGPAATALGKIGDRSALPSLAAAAQLGPVTRRLAAIEALGRMPDARASDLLTSLMDDPDISVRSEAIRALAEREDPETASALIGRLSQETDPASLATLADVLGRLGDPTSIPALLTARDRSASPSVRREMLNAIGSVVGGRDSFYPYLALDTFAREETISKALLNIQRRYRARATQRTQPGAARLAVRARQALETYIKGDTNAAIQKLSLLTDHQSKAQEFGLKEELARKTLQMLSERAGADQGMTGEEALLAVFLVQQITR